MINKNDLRKAIDSIAISNAKRNTIYKAFSNLGSITKEEFDSVKSDISKVVESMLTKDTVGKANGVASLDSNGSVPIKQLGNIDTTLFLIVRELPTTDIKTNKIYLVLNKDDQGNNIYVEYLYVENAWENLGEFKGTGASTAAAVTFDNTASGMTAVTAQGAIEELNVKKLAKADIVQETGNSEKLVISQKSVTELVRGIKDGMTASEYPAIRIEDFAVGVTETGSDRTVKVLEKFNAWLNAVDFSLSGKHIGHCIVGLDGRNGDVYNYVFSHDNKYGVQVLMGGYGIKSDGTIYSVDGYKIIYRVCNNGTNGEWKDYCEQSIISTEGTSTKFAASQKLLNDVKTTLHGNIDEVGSKVGNLLSTMLNGGEIKTVTYSEFTQNSSLSLTDPIILSEIGDYVEIKAKVEGKGILLISNAYSSNKPVIKYQYVGSSTDKVQLYVWMDGETATRSSKCISNALNANEEHIIKVILSSKSGNICTYEVYIDGAKIIAIGGYKNPITDGTQTTFHGVGLTDDAFSFDKKCAITYIKYVSNGASEVFLQGLSTKGTINGTVTENINNVKYKSTKEIEEKILSVDKNVGKIEKDLHSTNERIDKIIENKYEIQELTSEDSRVTITENYVIPGDGKPISSNGYNLFTFVAERNYNVWFTDGQKNKFPSFLAISTETIDGVYTKRRRYIKNSEDNLPTESESLSLKKGEKLYISTKTNELSLAKTVSWVMYYENGEELNGNLPLSKEHIEQVLNASSSMFVKKDSTSLIVFFANKKGSYIAYPLVKRYKDFQEGAYPSFLDNWGIENVSEYTFDNGIMSKKAQLFQNGEAELAINLPRVDTEEYKYVGGHAHGFENIVNADNGREFVILVDNVKVNENDEFSLRPCSKIEVYQHSTLCQAYSNSNPFADVTKKWVFYEGEVNIATTVKMLRDMSIRQAQFGMMCVYRRLNGNSNESYLTNKVIKDTMPYKTFVVEDNWNVPELRSIDHDACRIVEFGDYGLGFIMEIENDNRKTNGGMFVHNNGTGSYNKIYFDLTGDYQAKKDELFYATQVWSVK